MKAFIVLAAALLLPQEKNEAEELYKKMEAKFVQAKTIQMKMKAALNEGKVDVTAQLLVAEENRAHFSAEMKFMDSTRTSSSVSDGKSIQLTSAEGMKLPAYETPETFGQLIRKGIAACGGLFAASVFSGGQAGTDPATAYKASAFVLGPKEKVGEIETQMVQYSVALKVGGDLVVMVWIDPKTNLPVKRRLTSEHKAVEETYSELKFDEKIDPAKFELSKDK